jgi:hypothetical protein
MARKRKRLAATEVRVHLGEALKEIEQVDLVIEKGGVPVAIITRYEPDEPAAHASENATLEYGNALSKRAEPGSVAKMAAAAARGWVGIDPDALLAEIYRARVAGTSDRVPALDEGEDGDGDQPDHDSTLSGRFGRLHHESGPSRQLYIADRPDGEPGT